jgi:hypothetical protein
MSAISRRKVKVAGHEVSQEAGEDTGIDRSSIDPDGNPILIDQHR